MKIAHLVLFGSGFLALAVAAAQQPASPKIQNVPIQRTAATSGSEMYTTYCAVCHGADGKGNGPAATSLKSHPVDLTQLSKKNGGNFPSAHVATILQFGVENPAHGNKEMPIWGDLFQTLNTSGRATSGQTRLRISNLTDYLKTIQQK